MQTTDTIDIPKLRAELELAPDWALLSEDYNAAARGISVHLVRQERQRGTGVPYVKQGRRVLYRKSDIMEYLGGLTSISRPRAAPAYPEQAA